MQIHCDQASQVVLDNSVKVRGRLLAYCVVWCQAAGNRGPNNSGYIATRSIGITPVADLADRGSGELLRPAGVLRCTRR